jgi:hypothetical protein
MKKKTFIHRWSGANAVNPKKRLIRGMKHNFFPHRPVWNPAVDCLPEQSRQKLSFFRRVSVFWDNHGAITTVFIVVVLELVWFFSPHGTRKAFRSFLLAFFWSMGTVSYVFSDPDFGRFKDKVASACRVGVFILMHAFSLSF